MGMLAGSLVVSYISSKWATWTAMIFLLAIHLGTNYIAVRAVCMRTLNRQRANLVFSSILEQNGGEKAASLEGLKIPTPEEVRLRERVFERDGVLRWKGEILGYCKLGVSLKPVLDCFGAPDQKTGSHSSPQLLQFSELLDVFKGCGYIVWYDQPRKTFLVVLEEWRDDEPLIMLKAWMFALHFAKFGKIEEGESLLEAIGKIKQRLATFEDRVMERLAEHWDLTISAMETQSGTRIRIHGD